MGHLLLTDRLQEQWRQCGWSHLEFHHGVGHPSPHPQPGSELAALLTEYEVLN